MIHYSIDSCDLVVNTNCWPVKSELSIFNKPDVLLYTDILSRNSNPFQQYEDVENKLIYFNCYFHPEEFFFTCYEYYANAN